MGKPLTDHAGAMERRDRKVMSGNCCEDLIVGADLPGGDEFFEGTLANVKVFTYALTQEQVQQLSP
jgi:hypothetical protein